MKRNIILFAAASILLSCGLREIGGGDNINEEVWTGPGAGIGAGDSGAIRKSIWYATGFEYPEGYDWRSDPENGSVKCSLVVYANAVPMMKLPVGREYEVSADPDMHRIMDGNLYTDFSTDSMTVIRKNGQRIFSYQGREMMVSMQVDGEDVYTLGQDRTGRGFSLRKNGEVLYRNASGVLFVSSECHEFAFTETVQSADGGIERYYVCKDGEVSQIAVREDVKKVWDVKVSEDGIAYVASLVGITMPVLVSDGQMKSLDLPASTSLVSCRFVPGQEDEVVECAFASSGGLTSGIWRNGNRECIFPVGMTASSLCSWDDGICCVLTHCRTGEVRIFRFGETLVLPEGFAIMGSRPLSVVDGILYAALVPLDGGRPVVWKDGETEPLKILNGYISSITCQSSQETVRD